MQRPLTLVQRAFRPSSENLGRSVVHGAALTIVGVLFRTSITLGSMAILARLLSPSDFGLIAMATVVIELGALFANVGFGSILIQRPRIFRIQIDTVFWAALGLGCLLATLVFLFSFVADRLFAEAVVGDLLKALCVTFVIEELSVVPRSLLARQFQFRRDFVVQAVMLLCRATTAVLLAWQGFGVWSLAGAAIVASFVQMSMYTALVGYRPRLRFSTTFLTSTWRTNGGYFGNGLLFYINYNLDLFLVGRLLGAASLGFYQNARSLTDEIRARIAIPLQQVLFPAFSALQNEHERFRAGILRSGRLLALIVVPIGFGIAAVAEELVPLLYGDQWLAMIPVLKIISIGAGIRATTAIGNPIFNATNRVGLSFRLFSAGTAIFAATMLLGSRWGLTGVAYALLFSTAVALVFFRIALGLVRLRSVHLWQMLGVPSLSALLMFCVVVLARGAVHQFTEFLPLRLACLVLIGVCVYVGGVLAMSRSYLDDVRDVVAKFGRRSG